MWPYRLSEPRNLAEALGPVSTWLWPFSAAPDPMEGTRFPLSQRWTVLNRGLNEVRSRITVPVMGATKPTKMPVRAGPCNKCGNDVEAGCASHDKVEIGADKSA